MNNVEVKRTKMLCIDLLIVMAFLAIDQFTKYLSIVNLKGKAPIVLIENVLELQYLENRGSAFGILQNQKIFILCICVVFLAMILLFLFRLPQSKKFSSVHILSSLIIAGGIGNMVDRIRFDYVVDFISFVLIDFPIFNFADCCIVCGTIALFLLFVFVFKEDDLEFLNFKKKKSGEKD